MAKKKYLCVDCECTGRDPKVHQVIQVGLVCMEVRGKHWGTVDFERINVRHDVFAVDPEAMAVNGIDLLQHQKKALEPAAAVAAIVAFVRRNWGDERPDPVGHNYPFDAAFLDELTDGDWSSKIVSHRWQDTMAVLRFLSRNGAIPDGVAGMKSACQFFDIKEEEVCGVLHDALGDAWRTAIIYGILATSLRNNGEWKLEKEAR